ncbi:MAG: TenA family transcriptional regulator [Acidiferrobacterales bacterium]
MTLTCQQLLTTHESDWAKATRHVFLDDCQAGTIKTRQFNTWLVQDYLFVTEFTRMVAGVLVCAPIKHFDVTLAGLAALKDELSWFHTKADERQLDLNAPPQETCERYCRFMAELAADPYAVQAVALWAIEAAYNQAWQLASPMAKPYDEFADRWGNPNFTAYVAQLARQADEALGDSTDAEQAQAEAVFTDITKLEQSFWDMAFTADREG